MATSMILVDPLQHAKTYNTNIDGYYTFESHSSNQFSTNWSLKVFQKTAEPSDLTSQPRLHFSTSGLHAMYFATLRVSRRPGSAAIRLRLRAEPQISSLMINFSVASWSPQYTGIHRTDADSLVPRFSSTDLIRSTLACHHILWSTSFLLYCC